MEAEHAHGHAKLASADAVEEAVDGKAEMVEKLKKLLPEQQSSPGCVVLVERTLDKGVIAKGITGNVERDEYT